MIDDDDFNVDDDSLYQEWDSSNEDEYGDDDYRLSDYIYKEDEEW